MPGCGKRCRIFENLVSKTPKSHQNFVFLLQNFWSSKTSIFQVASAHLDTVQRDAAYAALTKRLQASAEIQERERENAESQSERALLSAAKASVESTSTPECTAGGYFAASAITSSNQKLFEDKDIGALTKDVNIRLQNGPVATINIKQKQWGCRKHKSSSVINWQKYSWYSRTHSRGIVMVWLWQCADSSSNDRFIDTSQHELYVNRNITK